jgi:hypothetical protein
MKTRVMLLGFSVVFASCVRTAWPRSAPVEHDMSISFPSFFGHAAVQFGDGAAPYELDGVVLKAIMVAMTDFLRPGGEDKPCWGSPEAHRYRVIRQGDIIFVRIDEDLEFCGLQYISVDTGVEYAISTDGRILRRLLDGEPRGSSSPVAPDAGVADSQGGGEAPASPVLPPAPSSDAEEGVPRLPE